MRRFSVFRGIVANFDVVSSTNGRSFTNRITSTTGQILRD
jgi:hypothetical protein